MRAVSIVGLVLSVSLGGGLIACTSDSHDFPAAETTEAQGITSFDDKPDEYQAISQSTVGDCFIYNIAGLLPTESTMVEKVQKIDCAQPHDAVIIGVQPVEFSEYPGEEVLFTQAERICAERLGEYQTEPNQQFVQMIYFVPPKEAWTDKTMQRLIQCAAVSPN
ncbi:hypothetical protein ACFLIN_03160 [Corynebacterium kutscheri]|uniref:hypothetical protein n=1 Tax=Corynebacterium kutscheri TaxID=35755 RepID=UPI0037BE27B4